MIIFFDVGQNGAISFFEKGKLSKFIKFQIATKPNYSIKKRLTNFQKLLKKEFVFQENITDVGCYQPFGTNRKTIIFLSMMIAVLVMFFINANFHFVNEWTAWKEITKNKTIPLRAIKKQTTIQWAEQKFKITEINDDQADAILGGFFLNKTIENQ